MKILRKWRRPTVYGLKDALERVKTSLIPWEHGFWNEKLNVFARNQTGVFEEANLRSLFGGDYFVAPVMQHDYDDDRFDDIDVLADHVKRTLGIKTERSLTSVNSYSKDKVMVALPELRIREKFGIEHSIYVAPSQASLQQLQYKGWSDGRHKFAYLRPTLSYSLNGKA